MTSSKREIQSAIDKLTKLRHNDGPWRLAGGNEWISPIGITVAPDDGGVSSREAELIVTLHATIDAQLAILEAAAGGNHDTPALEACATLLAHAINGSGKAG